MYCNEYKVYIVREYFIGNGHGDGRVQILGKTVFYIVLILL